MSFEILTDSASNLTDDLLEKYGIHMLSCFYLIDDVEYPCYVPGRDYAEAGREFYHKLRNKVDIKTSLINTARLIEFFEPFLQAGRDILFSPISSGLSGTFQAAQEAARQLTERYPERKCIIVDSLGASLGEGLLLCHAAKLRNGGANIEEVQHWIEQNRLKMRQIFTVDDLHFLRRGGRLSGAAALVGSLLNIKPLLKASDKGLIAMDGKTRGRRKALDALAKNFCETVVDPAAQTIGIAHCDCEADAQYLAEKIQSTTPVGNILIRYYDLCTGAHVGPGALALFYMGEHR